MGWSGTWLTWCAVVESVETSITLVDDVFAQVSVESEAFSTVVAHLVVRSMSTHRSVVAATFMVEVTWQAVLTEHISVKTFLGEADSTSVEMLLGFINDSRNNSTCIVNGIFWHSWASNVLVGFVVVGFLDTSSKELFPSVTVVTFSTTDQIS